MSVFGVVSRRALGAAFCLLCALSSTAAAQSPAVSDQSAGTAQQASTEANKGPFGYWKHIDDATGKVDSVFKLWEHEGTIRGKILKRFPVGGKDPEKLCSACEGKLKDKPIDGMLFLWDFKFDKEANKWVDGKVLNPKDGNVYHCQITLTKNGAALEVYGYIKMLVKIGGTSEWQRPTAQELEAALK